MIDDDLFSMIGLAVTALGAVLLYLGSEHQRLLRSSPPKAPVLIAGAVAVIAGIAAWVAAWGGLVGGLLALAVWMVVSCALPYLLARRSL